MEALKLWDFLTGEAFSTSRLLQLSDRSVRGIVLGTLTFRYSSLDSGGMPKIVYSISIFSFITNYTYKNIGN